MRVRFAFAAALLAAAPARATPMLDLPLPSPAADAFADIPPVPTSARARLLPLIQAEAARQGVPAALADAVAIVETGYTENATGSSGEIGLMQVMPGTAAGLGFAGPLATLYDPATNIHYGVSYLARAWAASGGDACRALMKYRAGVGENGFSPLSIQYCQRAAAWLRGQDGALADNVTRNTPAFATLTDGVVIGGGPHVGRIDATAMAEIAGIPNLVVERLPVAAWHISHRGRIHPDLRAIEAAAQGLDTDAHVIHILPIAP